MGQTFTSNLGQKWVQKSTSIKKKKKNKFKLFLFLLRTVCWSHFEALNFIAILLELITEILDKRMKKNYRIKSINEFFSFRSRVLSSANLLHLLCRLHSQRDLFPMDYSRAYVFSKNFTLQTLCPAFWARIGEASTMHFGFRSTRSVTFYLP